MKRTVLTVTQYGVLEELIAKHGLVVTTQDVLDKLAFETRESKYRFVSQLCEAGWLVRIKHGLYQIADVSSLSTLTLSRYAIAHLLLPEAYVSFQAALQFHGLFDQSLKSMSSVCLRQKSVVHLQGIAYHFVKTKAVSYVGFQTHPIDGMRVQIAEREKALIDLMQFHRTSPTVDLVLETLRDNHHQLNLQSLMEYALVAPVAVQRSLGFLMDGLKLDSTPLRAATRKSRSVSKLTGESRKYSSDWRLYYEEFFAKEMAHA